MFYNACKSKFYYVNVIYLFIYFTKVTLLQLYYVTYFLTYFIYFTFTPICIVLFSNALTDLLLLSALFLNGSLISYLRRPSHLKAAALCVLLRFYLSVCVCGVTGAKLWCHVSNYTELRPIDHVTSRSQICLLQASNCLDRIHHIQILYQPLCVYTRAGAHAIKCIVHLKCNV